jgi:hypothetical protein
MGEIKKARAQTNMWWWPWGKGLTVGLVVVPQSMAYAFLAQLSPEYGLFTSFAGFSVYWMFGTSRDVVVGVRPTVAPDRWVRLAQTLTSPPCTDHCRSLPHRRRHHNPRPGRPARRVRRRRHRPRPIAPLRRLLPRHRRAPPRLARRLHPLHLHLRLHHLGEHHHHAHADPRCPGHSLRQHA